jgi:hypothetical protein
MPACNPIVKCQYCDQYTTRLWGRDRKPSGYRRLEMHLYDAHPDVAKEIEQVLAEFYGDIIDDYEAEWERGVRAPQARGV